jgi:hypothetical protein
MTWPRIATDMGIGNFLFVIIFFVAFTSVALGVAWWLLQ